MANFMCWVSFKVAIIKAKAKESETPCNEVGVRKSRTPVLARNSFKLRATMLLIMLFEID